MASNMRKVKYRAQANYGSKKNRKELEKALHDEFKRPFDGLFERMIAETVKAPSPA